jgi:ribonuclease HI
LLVAWRAWHARNEVTHQKALPSIEGSKRFLCSYLYTVRNLNGQSSEAVIKGKSVALEAAAVRAPHSKQKQPAKPWCPPPPGWAKLSIDGSFKEIDGMAGAGMILRDDKGQIIFSACRSLLLCVDPLEAEIRACLEGLELSLHHSRLPLVIETDCFQLVSAVQERQPDRSLLMHFISEIKRLSSQDRVCKFVKVDRSQIRVSHCLANFARAEHQTDVWLDSGPEIMIRELEAEHLVTLSE